MIKRPKRGDDEGDILQMQEEFLREKSKNENYQPAAQVTNLRRSEPTKRPNTSVQGTRKPSKYAESKGLKENSEKRAKVEASTSSVLGEIIEKKFEVPEKNEPEGDDDNVYFPKVIPSVLGNIVEKNLDTFVDFNVTPMPSSGFPDVDKYVPGKKSNFRQKIEKNKLKDNVTMDIDEPSTSNANDKTNVQCNLPEKSYIVASNDANEIHSENVKVLKQMSELEILEERQKLLSTLDPKLVEYLKARRQAPKLTANEPLVAASIKDIAIRERNVSTSNINDNDTLWENDVLSHPEVNKWLHFDSLEKDKLEWMKGIKESRSIKANEPYEARFDFNGYLLPYTIEYTENTKTLFHHGEEPHRPGYSLTELIELTRSTVTQQRVMALNTIAGVLEYYTAGIYKDVIEIPLSKLFFIIRIAMDENKATILEPALKAMRNLLYNRLDEASLDALLGFEEGTLQPNLENDKSEIEALESKESELNDFHLAEIDIIAAILRTDILQRLFYILDTVKPSFNCVQYCLQILIRLARDSIETAHKIVQTEHLMNAVIKNFIPTTSINFAFEPQIVYNGKPVLAALKLLRILTLQSELVSRLILTNYGILQPISEYISSIVDRTYGLRIQIEAYCLLSNLLYYGLGIENAKSLSPIIITALYKHVKGTDIYPNSSILSATHAAVVLQLINKLLSCNLSTLESHKSQIYPLIKEGVLKWIGQLSNSENYTCGHLRLLCSALDCCKTVIVIENVPVKFFCDSLKQLSASRGFNQIINNLIPSSNLLSSLENKDLHLTKNLMSLGSSVIGSRQKVLPILNYLSPLPFLVSIVKILLYMNDKQISELYLRHLAPYMSKLENNVPKLCDNWFTRMETDFVFNTIMLSIQNESSEANKDLLYAVASKLCYILRSDKKYELEFIFNNIVFNKHWFTAERLLNLVNLSDADGFSTALSSIEQIKIFYSKVINLKYRDTGPNVALRKWMEPVLPRDWIYLPILTLYSKSQEPETMPEIVGEHAKRVAEHIAAEKGFIIRCSLEWILFNELCFPDLLNDIEVTDRFCRIMCVYLCDSSLFLDANIKILLRKCIQILFKKKSKLNFDKQMMGLSNFQDFYTQFLEQFQSVSYGDQTFAACVLVPLAQRHNVKWRKLLWSEYAGCLRALDCPEEMLCYDFKEYLYPEETDDSLIKSYFHALSGSLLRPNTIAHKIATHHVECYKKRICK